MLKLGFVVPWYGPEIAGGAEAECRELIRMFRAQGYAIEALTTCVEQFRSDWSVDYHPPGLTIEDGVPVRRFPVRRRATQPFDHVNWKLMRDIPISPEEESLFFREMIHSPELYRYLEDHRGEYLLFFMPYMFGTTVEGSRIDPDRSILIPCLHDESYARLATVRDVFERVRAVVFHTEEELQLAQKLYGLSQEKSFVLGEPVPSTWQGSRDAFYERHGVRDFLLYAGRADHGKNPEVLLACFEAYQRERDDDLRLVFIGGDPIEVPATIRDKVLLLGRVSEQEKYDCFSACLAVCVPSVYESFSLVMMEGWLAGRPAIVNARCAVTRSACLRSQGGLFFRNAEEFIEIVDVLRSDAKVADALGQQGGEFVRTQYGPEIVAARYEGLLRQLGA